MEVERPAAVVAGHLCLDLAPSFKGAAIAPEELLRPGGLVEVGPVHMSTGGCVSNTGLALARLGVRTHLIGKIGEDFFGDAVQRLLNSFRPAPSVDLVCAAGQATSYTVVINPPRTDRSFLHHPGVNDSFHPDEIGVAFPEDTRFFHFGYPPLMRETYADGGTALSNLFARIRARGVAVTMDMAMPDPSAPSGRVDWRSWLMQVLPEVDAFLPSLDETEVLLRRAHEGGTLSLARVRSVAEELLSMGAGAVLLKLGAHGLYLRTSPLPHRVERLVRTNTEAWIDREMLVPCFEVDVRGTTGAGDTTIAGFLAAVARDQSPAEAMTSAVAVGATSVAGSDSVGAIPGWDQIQEMCRDASRPRLPTIDPPGGHWSKDGHVWSSRSNSPED